DTFNDGLRVYYFSFAALAWLISPMAMILGTLIVVAILYSREFHSDVLHVLGESARVKRFAHGSVLAAGRRCSATVAQRRWRPKRARAHPRPGAAGLTEWTSK